MGKVLIVFASRTGETQTIADLIAEGVRMAGHQADVVNVKNVKSETDLAGYDGYVFGSATYHGDMLQAMKTFLFIAEKALMEGKIGGAFGSFGWSGEANDRIFQTMKKRSEASMHSGIPSQSKSWVQSAPAWGFCVHRSARSR